MLAQFLLQSAEMIVRRGVPAPMVGKLLLLSIPNIIVITIPMSFLFAILVAVGRLSADNELVAMRSSGVSLMSLYRPVFVLSVLLTIESCCQNSAPTEPLAGNTNLINEPVCRQTCPKNTEESLH